MFSYLFYWSTQFLQTGLIIFFRSVICPYEKWMCTSDLELHPDQLTFSSELWLVSANDVIPNEDKNTTTTGCGIAVSPIRGVGRGRGGGVDISLLEISGVNHDSVPITISGFSDSNKQWNSGTLLTTDWKLIFITFIWFGGFGFVLWLIGVEVSGERDLSRTLYLLWVLNTVSDSSKMAELKLGRPPCRHVHEQLYLRGRHIFWGCSSLDTDYDTRDYSHHIECCSGFGVQLCCNCHMGTSGAWVQGLSAHHVIVEQGEDLCIHVKDKYIGTLLWISA